MTLKALICNRCRRCVAHNLGIKEFAITSSGEKFENPKDFQKSLRRLKIRQRRLSKKPIGSNNRNKARLFVAKIHEKVANQR